MGVWASLALATALTARMHLTSRPTCALRRSTGWVIWPHRHTPCLPPHRLERLTANEDFTRSINGYERGATPLLLVYLKGSPMPEETPVLSPVRLIELRSFAHWSSSYLQRVLDTTYVPEPERLVRVIRDLRELGLALPESPTVE
jgi:hypothetical protein